jgi:hypothetical protein
MLKPLGVMPPRGGATAVREAERYVGDGAGLAIGGGYRPPLPEQQGASPTVLHGLPELDVLVLPREGRSRPNTAGSGCSFKAKPRRHRIGNPLADVGGGVA